MTDLGPDARAILNAAEDAHDPDPATRARVRAAVFRRVSAGAVIATSTAVATTTTAGASTSASIGGAFFIKALVVAALATGGATALHRTMKPVAAAAVMTASPSALVSALAVSPEPLAPIVAPVAPPAPVVEPAPVVVPAPAPVVAPASASAPVAAPAPAPAPAKSTLDDELTALQQAHLALRAGRPADALTILDATTGTSLGQERAATRVLALCALNAPDARAAADRFIADHPSSPLVPRIRTACTIP